MKTIIALLAGALNSPAFAAEPYAMQSLTLLQPEVVVSERVRVEDLSDYVKSVNADAQASLASSVKPTPTAGFIVVAVRPGSQSRVWLDFSPVLPPRVAARLVSSLEQVAPFKAKGGVVVFAINCTLWGAPATERQGPSPDEWKEAMKGMDGPVEIGDLVERIWPPEAGA